MKPVPALLGMFAAFSLAGAGTLIPGTVLAQAPERTPGQTEEQQVPPAAQPPAEQAPDPAAAQIPDEKIEQFANAFADIQAIQSEATKELESTTDETQANQVVTDAETQMIAAVERSGLAVDEFNRIAELMTTDVAVRARVAEKLQKRSGG